MTTFSEPSFWLNFFYFFLAISVAFFIPGNIMLKRQNLSFLQNIVLSTVLGMVSWSLLGFIFGYLGLRWITYPYLVITFIIWLWINRQKREGLLPYLKKIYQDRLLLAILVVGTCVQLLSTLFLGISYKDGLYFCCALPDSLYHLSLTDQLTKQIPPFEPGASGVIVANYHYLSNLVIAELVRIFDLPLMATQYQYSVLLLSLFYGLSGLAFAQTLGLNKKYAYWLLFFLYFSGDLTYILLLLLGKGLNFSLPFLENASWLWISPPRVYASVIFFSGLSLLSLWIKDKKVWTGILMSIILGSLIGFKVYVGLFILSGLLILGCYYLLKKDYFMILPLLATALISLLLYFPVNKNSGGFIFTGIWRFENFIVSPALGLSYLELARQIYYTHNNWLRLIQYNVIYIGTYFIFVFGTIISAIFQTKKSLSLLRRELNIFLITGIAVSMVLGSFFIQQVGGANSSQFLITVDIIASIYAALACFYWTEKIDSRLIKKIAILLIIILTIPRVTYTSYQSLQSLANRQGFFIDNSELQALSYIKNNSGPSSVILVDNINKAHWRNAFSLYIGPLSGRQIFLDGEGITQDHGVDVIRKIDSSKMIFSKQDPLSTHQILLENKIDYIYTLTTDNLFSDESNKFLKTVFKNDKIHILKVLPK